MSTAPSVDPGTPCAACAASIPTPLDRFCAACGRPLRHADRRPGPPAEHPWELDGAAPATQPGHRPRHGLAASLGGALVLALLVLSAAVILAVTRSDTPTPQVDNGASTAAASAPVSP
ncbi:MAG TPA: hypothetical protein VGM33_09765 [Baekduia sp.]|jgi:hypothetical protein